MPTPNEVLQLKKPTKGRYLIIQFTIILVSDFHPNDSCSRNPPSLGFLCPLSANTYSIEFLSFFISDFCSKRKLFAIGEGLAAIGSIEHDDNVSSPDDVCRQIKYTFPEDVLRLRKVSTS